jgi:hypothetical protein
LQHIETVAEKSCLELLSRKQYRDLLVIGEVYRQQEQMLMLSPGMDPQQ